MVKTNWLLTTHTLCVCFLCMGTCVKVREQLVGLGSLLPSCDWRLNLDLAVSTFTSWAILLAPQNNVWKSRKKAEKNNIWWVRHSSKCLQNYIPCNFGLVPLWKGRKVKLRDIEYFVQGHTANKDYWVLKFVIIISFSKKQEKEVLVICSVYRIHA